MAKIAEARKTVEQLKLEVNIDRMKVRGGSGEEGGGRGAGVQTPRGWRWGPWEDPLRNWVGPGAGQGRGHKGAFPGVAETRGGVLGGEQTALRRPQVSQAAAELLAFCETHAKDDPLVTPVPAAENPFRDKRLFCVLL